MFRISETSEKIIDCIKMEAAKPKRKETGKLYPPWVAPNQK
jgi:hypothetical protein